jgi:hypothetical protein
MSPKGKKRVQNVSSPAVKLAGDLLKLSEKCNRFLAVKYDSANVRVQVNAARESLSAAAALAQELPETWKPGKPKKALTEAQIVKLKAKAAKLAEQIAEAEAAQA